MTLYAFPPYGGCVYDAFTTVPGALSADEAAEWVRLGDSLPLEPGVLARAEGPVVDRAFREAKVAWLAPDGETEGVFERLAALVERVNGEHFGFDLVGFAEPVQYTVYEAPSVGYDWHCDMKDSPAEVQRKLSLTIQLTGATDYEGGDLELRDGDAVVTAPREQGCLIAFPSWALHRVTPVTRGVRRSLVAWVGGPRFR
jgi:PKHD-type hydroxylase